jgi:hypothetical protein
MANDVEVEIGLDSTKFQKEMDKMAKSVSTLGDSINQNFTGKINNSLQTFQGTLGGLVAFKGIELIADQFRKLGEEISKAVGVADRKEAGLTKLGFAIKTSGRGASEATKDFSDFADEIERTTKFTDDQAIASATLLANTTNLSNKGIKEAVKASADLATVMGVDLESATQSLAKAQQGHLDRLLKNTLHIREGNDASQTWANTLQRLTSLQGSAGSTLDTYAGKTDQLAKAQENVQEALGNIIIKNSQVLGFLQGLREQMDQNEKSAISNSENLSSYLSNAILYALSFTKVLVDVVDVFGRAFSVMYNAVSGTVKGLLVAFNTLFLGIAKGVGTLVSYVDEAMGQSILNSFKDFEKGTEAMATSTIDDFKSIGEAITGDTYVSKLSANLDKLALTTAGFRVKEKKETEADNEEKVQKAYDTERAILEARSKLRAENTALSEQLLVEKQNFLEMSSNMEITNLQERALAELATTRDTEDAKIIATMEAEIAKTAFIKDQQEKNLTQEKIYRDAQLKRQQNFDKSELALEDMKGKNKVANQKDTLNAIATLSSAHNKTLATIGKAAAITSILIDAPVAHEKALAAFPPPFNFIAAGLVDLASAAQIARVSGVQFENGGIVGGTSFSGDNIQARVNSGEMILNRQQQAQLFEVAQGKGKVSGGVDATTLQTIIQAIQNTPIIVQANGREIAKLVREESRSGFSFA